MAVFFMMSRTAKIKFIKVEVISSRSDILHKLYLDDRGHVV